MKFNIVSYILISIFSFYLSSCDRSSPIPDSGTILETIEATINFDLSSRTNWKLYAGDKRYQFTVDGSTLYAKPYGSSKPFVFPHSTGTGKMQLLLFPPDYGKTRSESTLPPNFENQSTYEKFMACDMLKAEYSGMINPNLQNITLYHENALLNFNVTNIPQNANVFIGQIRYQKIKPLKDGSDPTSYKAIVFPTNYYKSINLVVETDHKTYSTTLESSKTRMPSHYPEGLGNSAVVSFHAFINEQDELEIENLKREAFSKEWPIIQ